MFKRGFKSWCDQTAEAIRRQRGMQAWEPLSARSLAEDLKAVVITPRDLPMLSPEICLRLLRNHNDIWSAITISSDPPLIVYNPEHSPGRQNSDLMHELAHLLLEHVPGTVYIDPKSKLVLRHHDRDQEDQANWLAGCLLLPRAALVKIKQAQWPNEEVCKHYLVSSKMLIYRMNTSGVNIQFGRRGGLIQNL
jgi:Zn-dependent peptidase ImmA (M78 family)